MKHQRAKLVTNGFYKEALNLYTHHHSTSLLPHKFTFPPLFKACAKLKSPTQGQIIHAHLIKSGFSSDVYATNSLIGMYTKLNILSDALKVFDEMPDRNLVSLTSAISVFAHNGYLRQALRVFKEAMVGTFRPDSVTVVSALSACESVDNVLQMHCLAIKLGVEMHVYVANSLMTMYSNKKEIILATRVFGEMPEKDVVSYNAIFTGLLNNGVPLLVLKVFKDMKKCLSEAPNSVTFISVISTCANLSYLQFGRQVHGLIQKIGMQSDTKVGTALVDMYSKCGCLPWAHNVFQELNESRDILTWNSMISGMMLNGQSSKAMELFDQLAHEGFKPNSSTWNSMIREFSQQGMGFESFKYFQKMQLAGTVPSLTCILSVLSSCARYSALKCGKETHGHVIRTELNKDEFVATTLIYMYMKCGQPAWARRVFDQFEIKPDDPAFWSAMMSGYRMNGDYESAVEVFGLMQEEKAVRMSSLVRKRLIRDFKRLQYDPPAGISGAPQDNNTVLWNAVVFGPDDTPWDGGTFKLTLQFIEGYPNKLPTVHFVSRMFHPNIFADGSICLDILQNQWSPIYDVVAILTSIQSLLCNPNPNSLANLEAAQMFSENKWEYNRKIREMVEQSWIAD